MKNVNNSKLRIIPLGGLEQIGMNITAFEFEDSIVVVDCGLAFPEDDMLGIDLVIPDVSYLKQNLSKVKGFVITHGHEDHIGALPYILKDINVPVYSTKLTIALIENKLKEHNMLRTTKRKVVRHGQSINLGKFRVEFIKTNHSIADASALAIYSPAGTVVHTGDFKVDYTPVYGDSIDLQRFGEITHGHEDHIGALPYILKDINVPVYSTKLTIALIENKLKEHNMLRTTKRKVVRHGQSINLGKFRVEFIKTNHSIADASALAIYSPAGTVVHTGDFKVDYTPVYGDSIDLQRFGEIGKKGVLALMCDSTNAERPGITQSEKTVGRTMDTLFAEHCNSRIIVATFASNVDRVQQIINSAYKYNKKVVIEGRSMVNVISTAAELGYINVPDNTLIEIEQLNNYPPEATVLITTGSQGESMAALSRMAQNLHRRVHIMPGDTVIFSSNPIPGNEKAVSKVINELSAKGANVIFQDAHVSGHACQEEIKLIYSLVHPKYAIPVHGEYRHLKAQASIAEQLGIEKENIFVMRSGDVIEMDENSAKIVDKVHTGAIFVDGLGVGDVGSIVMRDRQHLAEDGIMIIVLTLDKGSNTLLSGPDIVSRGFVYVRESEDLMEQARAVVYDAVEKCLDRHITDWGKMKNVMKDALGDYIRKKTKRNPMILPIIMEV